MKNVRLTKEQRIINRLLLESSMIQDIGLLHGKTGIMLFFMHYYRFTSNVLYEDVASELLDEITNNLNEASPINFESGLCGIGWAINYLIAKNFVEGDSLDICEDINNKIMETDPRRLTDYSLENGLGGILLYVLSSINVVYSQQQKLPFDIDYIHSLYIACINVLHSKKLPSNVINLLESYIKFYIDKTLHADSIWDISLIIERIANLNEKKISNYPLGLKQGLSGTLFNELYLCKL